MKKLMVLIGLAVLASACATFNRDYTLGNEAELNMKWEEAIPLYEKAVLAEPHDPVYRMALIRAKHAASLYYLNAGRRLVAQGKKDEALADYDRALLYDPLNNIIIAERDALLGKPAPEEVPPLEKIEPPIQLKVKEEKLVLNFPNETSLRTLFLTLGKAAGVNVLFDDQFRDVPFSINLSDVGFEQALNALCTATKNFYRIVDEHTVIVVPDTPIKRLQYEVNAIRSFALSNIKAEDILQSLQQMLSSQFKAVKVFADKNLNVITVRDTPATINLAAQLIRLWDRPKGEVIIDLELMEVLRSRLRQLGISFDQNIIGMRYGPPTTTTSEGTTVETSSWTNLKGLNFGNSANYYVSLPIAYLEFLQTDSDTKLIAQPRLRGISGEQIETLVGQRVPIPQTTFTPIAAGGVNQQPVTSFEYKDIGINVKVKPTVHPEGDVTLEMDLEITSLGGTGYANIPIITTRKVKNVLRLKDGETNLLAGLLRDDERKSLTGIPGLQDLPLVGRLFAHEVTTLEQTDVILTITPYIIRKVPVSAQDSKPIWVDVDQAGAALGEGGEEESYFEPQEIPERAARRTPSSEPGVGQVVFSPGNFELPKGRDFRITVSLRGAGPIGNFSMNVTFNSQVMHLKEVTEGPLLRQGGAAVPFFKNIDNNSGICTLGFTSPDMVKGLSASGPVAVLLFEALAPGEGVINATSVGGNAPGGQSLTFEVRPARVAVR
jgi:general secretion pathway protein D